jgi:hypothetical protein
MLSNTIYVVLIIIGLIFLAGTIDFLLKEVYWQKLQRRGGTWSQMPKIFEHKYGWWVWITCIWVLPLFYFTQFNNLFYAGFILFSLEDAVYFFWKKLIYKKIGITNFNYLLPTFLRKYEVSRKELAAVIIIQIIVFCIVVIISL